METAIHDLRQRAQPGGTAREPCREAAQALRTTAPEVAEEEAVGLCEPRYGTSGCCAQAG